MPDFDEIDKAIRQKIDDLRAKQRKLVDDINKTNDELGLPHIPYPPEPTRGASKGRSYTVSMERRGPSSHGLFPFPVGPTVIMMPQEEPGFMQYKTVVVQAISSLDARLKAERENYGWKAVSAY